MYIKESMITYILIKNTPFFNDIFSDGSIFVDSKISQNLKYLLVCDEPLNIKHDLIDFVSHGHER